jgi:hypothetical protein
LNCDELQTQAFQKVFDMCKENGGMVVVPKGKYHVAALRMWSNTTLYLESGAEIYGSDNCDDYEVFPIPEGMEMRSDMELISQYYGTPWETYRRAMITAYGEKNISIIGETNSVLDGRNCYDPDGEEGYRGPHIVFFSCCENVLFEGYIARHSGNFLHEANNCRNLTMRRVTCLGGSDGIHLHCTENALIEDCLFKTGDDCIAGINVKDLLVRRCILNTSCNLFRMGGVNVHIEDCYAYGPGYYPHRMTVVKGKNDELPREQGRHNTLWMVEYFSSANYPYVPSDIHFKNCVFENIHSPLYYIADSSFIQNGIYLGEMTFENVRFTDLKDPGMPIAKEDNPLKVVLKNVSVEYKAPRPQQPLFIAQENSFVTIIEE